MWTDFPDKAIQALADRDLTELSQMTEGHVHVYWNAVTGSWQLRKR
jgi:hypothetical protein